MSAMIFCFSSSARATSSSFRVSFSIFRSSVSSCSRSTGGLGTARFRPQFSTQYNGLPGQRPGLDTTGRKLPLPQRLLVEALGAACVAGPAPPPLAVLLEDLLAPLHNQFYRPAPQFIYSHLTCTKEMLPWELLGRNRCSFALYAALASLMWVSQVARSVVEPACSSYSWAPTWTLPPVFMR